MNTQGTKHNHNSQQKSKYNQNYSPLIPHEATSVDEGRLGHVVGYNRPVRSPEQHVRRELAPYDRNVGREVHPQYAQHASRPCVSSPHPNTNPNRNSPKTISKRPTSSGSAITCTQNPPALIGSAKP